MVTKMIGRVRQPLPRSVMLMIHGVVLVLTAVALGRPAAAQPSFQEIVDRVKAVNPTLQTFIVDQIIDVRFLGLFHWRIHSTVYAARPARYKIVMRNLPLVLRGVGNAFADMTSPEEILAGYQANAIQALPDNRLHLELVATHNNTNPRGGAVIVDVNRWLIEELHARYDWGEVRANYTYGTIEGYALPISARMWALTFPIRADLTFSNYQINVPIPQGTFEGRPANP